jgi:hypothetical protein
MDYHEMRKTFEPVKIKLVLLAESPPVSPDGRYFYNTAGSTREPLFKATMLAFGIVCKDKALGLREFQRRGVLLLDAVYEPVNKQLDKAKRGEAIERGYDELVERLSKLPPGVPVVIIMASLYDRLFYRLKNSGVNVVKRRIPFPAHNPQNIDKFREELASIVAEYH